MTGAKVPEVRRLLRLTAAVIAVVALAASGCGRSGGPSPASSTGPSTVYVGTYTGSGSEGIYRFTFDPGSGDSTQPVLAGRSDNPSFLALHPNGRVLFAANELATFRGEPTGAVSSFAIAPATGDLTPIDQQPSGGADPCFVAVDRTGRDLLVANYTAGSVAVIPTGDDGHLRAASAVVRHTGSGPVANRQDGPHAHEIVLDATERFAFAVDLGADRIFAYRFEAGAGTLVPADPPEVALPLGSGPRHLAWHPSGRFLYVVNELSSTVTSLRYGERRDKLTFQLFQTSPTVPRGYTGPNRAAEIAVSPDGDVLYASNRGHDSIAVYAIDRKTGILAARGHVATGGRSPRHFAIDPSGRWLLVANEESDAITVFELDPVTGHPRRAGAPIAVKSPACIVFAPQSGGGAH